MSDWLTAGATAASALGGLSQGITGLFNIGFNRRAYWRALEREDNAVQRRVQDMKAAGINPMLAAGSGASSMSPTMQQTPDLSGFSKPLEALMQRTMMHKANTDITRTKADIDRVKAETEGINIRNSLIKDEFQRKRDLTDAEIGRIEAQVVRIGKQNKLTDAQITRTNYEVVKMAEQVGLIRAQKLLANVNRLQAESYYEKWKNSVFPKGGIHGMIGGAVAALSFVGTHTLKSLSEMISRGDPAPGSLPDPVRWAYNAIVDALEGASPTEVQNILNMFRGVKGRKVVDSGSERNPVEDVAPMNSQVQRAEQGSQGYFYGGTR